MICRAKSSLYNYLQWTGKNHREMFNFLESADDSVPMNSYGEHFRIAFNVVPEGGLVLKTQQGEFEVQIGDYVLTDEEGGFDFFVVPEDDFHTEYENKESITGAEKILNYTLRTDEQYRYGWQSNIALIMTNEFEKLLKMMPPNPNISPDIFMNMAHFAAHSFLNVLTDDNKLYKRMLEKADETQKG